jgi:hypothetical protein
LFGKVDRTRLSFRRRPRSPSDDSRFLRSALPQFVPSPLCLDGITLHTEAWKVTPMRVDRVQSSFFDDTVRFPEGSAVFDCALLMRDIPHEWHSEADLIVGEPGGRGEPG